MIVDLEGSLLALRALTPLAPRLPDALSHITLGSDHIQLEHKVVDFGGILIQKIVGACAQSTDTTPSAVAASATSAARLRMRISEGEASKSPCSHQQQQQQQ